MGGSRCTFRSCCVRSDGVVHLFHYPVYDKIRCHQWLVNAHRLDFLNLKISQLRNRVVCQHHFKDDCFMNYKKDKLTFGAIPTEDGPHCNTTKNVVMPVDQITKAYSDALNDDDENDKYAKINFKNSSITYADFLTNGDVWEKKSLNETIWNNMVITKKEKNDENKITIEWNGVDEIKYEKKNRPITLTDLIEDFNETKNINITEFENPLLASYTFKEERIKKNLNKEIVDTTKRSNRNKNNSTKTNKIEFKQHFSPLLASQDIIDVNVNQKHGLAIADTNLDNIIVSNHENNNMTVNFDNLVVSKGTNTGNKTRVSVNQNAIHTYGQSNKEAPTDQSLDPVIVISNTNNYDAIIENPLTLTLEVKQDNIIPPLEDFNKYTSTGPWKEMNTNFTSKPKVTILSEETVFDPILFKGQLEPISPSAFVQIPKKNVVQNENTEKRIEQLKINAYEIDYNQENNENNLESKIESNEKTIQDFKFNQNSSPEKDKNQLSEINLSVKKNKKSNEVSIKPCVVKHKMAPERIAAIEKKRKFNKRLRDIIEICLDNLDDQDKMNEETKVVDAPKLNELKVKADNLKQNMGTYLSKQEELPNPQEYMMKFLEERMKKMENNLLTKIEQNSRKIIDVKKSISKILPVSKAAGTQTSQSQECHKKYLYNEISKFVSPDTNNLLYEELFLNKFSQKLSNPPSAKRRKRR